ncbi:class I SAM-dependent methyltransferase [Edaphobacter albus]|uniref:class I SAM-dependent methyltransferase n=1 Tax=Edaphobacter sp. 4G125 TaxID=2763071 RepID=UPI0016446A43|nr:class I SAM-dependent methyltransferase [Edaphobacter sp. 4G125]QNI37716.1 class I SAM-dependent methyltransferase [Edaphobacter sp. 4G125]
MSIGAKWEAVYSTRAADEVSWFRPHLETSLELINRFAGGSSAAIIDVGGGEATLADDLLQQGFQNLTVLDISKTALEVARKRIGSAADRVHWIVSDITEVNPPASAYDLWHDRAVFHFLTMPEARKAYIERATSAIKAGGHLVLSTFGPNGPTKCSGLDVMRYSPEALQALLAPAFRLVADLTEIHTTPAGAEQQFTYGVFQKS